MSAPSGQVGPMVVAVDVHKYFGALHALDGISLEIAPAEILCIIGPSGSGKSTFLRCINQLERIDGGAIWVDGALAGYRRVGDALHPLTDGEIARQRLSSGMVFQRFNLFAHMTALENIIEGPVIVQKQRKGEAVEAALALLQRVGLADKRDAYPAELSGGQQQRVAIARALVTEPTVLLADEPTGNLDSRTSIEVMALFQALNDQGITVILVTHEPDVARYAKRIIEMRDGQIRKDHPVIDRHIAVDDLAELDASAPVEEEVAA
jgi:polar amino acid transport system ATP-binding protein